MARLDISKGEKGDRNFNITIHQEHYLNSRPMRHVTCLVDQTSWRARARPVPGATEWASETRDTLANKHVTEAEI